MIISISGRKGSGKSTLCEELIKRDFIKISFADSLKEYCSQLYNFPVQWTLDQEEKEKIRDIPHIWNEEKCKELSILIKEEIKFKQKEEFESIRKMLQFIGTEVLREHDPDFHVKKTLEKIDPNKNYCLDDLRFLNEKEYLEKQQSILVFVIRPNNFEYSNHQSEIELNWTMFDRVIINNKNKKTFSNMFNQYLDILTKKLKLRKNLEKNINEKELKNALIINNFDLIKTSTFLKVSRWAIYWLSRKYLLESSRSKFLINKRSFLDVNKYSAYFAGLLSADGSIVKTPPGNIIRLSLYSNDICLIEDFKKFLGTDKPHYYVITNSPAKNKNYSLVTSDPFIIENIKLWNIKPNKSKYNLIPDIIKKEREMLKYWVVGLIDGDGTITIENQKSYYKEKIYNYKRLRIVILASKEVIDFIEEQYKHIKTTKIKKIHYKNIYIENMYELYFCDNNAIQFYKEVYKDMGLKRKWEKVEKYIEEIKNKKPYKFNWDGIDLEKELKSGKTFKDIANKLGIHPTTVADKAKKLGISKLNKLVRQETK